MWDRHLQYVVHIINQLNIGRRIWNSKWTNAVLTNGKTNTEGNISDGIHPSIDSTATKYYEQTFWGNEGKLRKIWFWRIRQHRSQSDQTCVNNSNLTCVGCQQCFQVTSNENRSKNFIQNQIKRFDSNLCLMSTRFPSSGIIELSTIPVFRKSTMVNYCQLLSLIIINYYQLSSNWNPW